MKFNVNIKSGTGGWADYDGCDKRVAQIESDSLPCIGDILHIHREGDSNREYLVTQVHRIYTIPKEDGQWRYGESVTVYVIPY